MSKAERLREMQQEINKLKNDLEQANKIIGDYRRRDKAIVLDFVKPQGAVQHG